MEHCISKEKFFDEHINHSPYHLRAGKENVKMNGFETKRKINIGMQYLVCCFAAMSDNTEGELSAFVSNCKLVFLLLPQWNKPDILLTCQAAP